MMQRATFNVLKSVAMVAIVSVAACQQQDVTDVEDSATVAVPESQVYESPGKPDLVPVDVKYRLLDTPQVGKPFGIELTIVSSVASGGLGYSVDAENGLMVDPEFASQNFVSSKPALSPETRTLMVTPTQEGRFYIRVAGSVVVDGVSKSRIVSIPIQVGEGSRALQEFGEVKTDAEGNPVVSMPATESRD